jgi:chromate reductase
MKVLAFAASLRKDSLNRKLIRIAAEHLKRQGVEVDLADFHEFDMPLYDGDIQDTTGLPAGALEFSKRLKAADALLISSPEYNYSLPGTLKNLIDWVSRERPTIAFRGKTTQLLSASMSPVGGVRGLWQLRIPLEGLGAFVCPDMFALAEADDAFSTDEKSLNDAKLEERLAKMLSSFVHTARALQSK